MSNNEVNYDVLLEKLKDLSDDEIIAVLKTDPELHELYVSLEKAILQSQANFNVGESDGR